MIYFVKQQINFEKEVTVVSKEITLGVLSMLLQEKPFQAWFFEQMGEGSAVCRWWIIAAKETVFGEKYRKAAVVAKYTTRLGGAVRHYFTVHK